MTTAAELTAGGETLEPVRTVAERLTGRRPCPSSIWRWCRSGVGPGGSLKLAAVCHGRHWLTTKSAFLAFLDAQTAGASSPAPEAAADDDTLSAAGVL